MLLDTSGLLTLLSSREPLHALARETFLKSPRCVVHNYVIVELFALATVRGVPRRQVLEYLDGLIKVPEVDLVWVDAEIHARGVQLLKERTDKTYSLCDAVSFVLMRDHGIFSALTTDHHFPQEGFVRLLE